MRRSIFIAADNKENEGRRGRVYRPFILLILVLVVGYGFWTNNARRFEAIAMQGLFVDETRLFQTEKKEEILRNIKFFRQDFGIPLEVRILRQAPGLEQREGVSGTPRIYLDIVPDRREAYLTLPPLARHAVGEEFVFGLERSLRRNLASESWQEAVLPAITALRAKLAEVTR
ncbi:hypothetical protein FACS1894206_03090 [Deltaproteobacteria bacterium]|nr:hypothetical protein FACS1894206_03090 [Deltaproteobacteria bacterium]